MEQPVTIGLDLAKTVFQGSSVKRSIRGIDRSEERSRRDRRGYPEAQAQA